MRPRISKEEAAFIVECLALRKEEIEGLVKRREQLDLEVYRLRRMLRYDAYQPFKQGFKEKKQELAELEAQSYRMFLLVSVFDSLMAKYSHIAEGTKRKGRYKSRENFYKWLLPRVLDKIEPKTPEKVESG